MPYRNRERDRLDQLDERELTACIELLHELLGCRDGAHEAEIAAAIEHAAPPKDFARRVKNALHGHRSVQRLIEVVVEEDARALIYIFLFEVAVAGGITRAEGDLLACLRLGWKLKEEM